MRLVMRTKILSRYGLKHIRSNLIKYIIVTTSVWGMFTLKEMVAFGYKKTSFDKNKKRHQMHYFNWKNSFNKNQNYLDQIHLIKADSFESIALDFSAGEICGCDQGDVDGDGHDELVVLVQEASERRPVIYIYGME